MHEYLYKYTSLSVYTYTQAHIHTKSRAHIKDIHFKEMPGPIDFYRINQILMAKLNLGLNLTQARVTGTKDPSSSPRYY